MYFLQFEKLQIIIRTAEISLPIAKNDTGEIRNEDNETFRCWIKFKFYEAHDKILRTRKNINYSQQFLLLYCEFCDFVNWSENIFAWWTRNYYSKL